MYSLFTELTREGFPILTIRTFLSPCSEIDSSKLSTPAFEGLVIKTFKPKSLAKILHNLASVRVFPVPGGPCIKK